MESKKYRMTWRDSIFYSVGLITGLTIMYLLFSRMVQEWERQGRLK